MQSCHVCHQQIACNEEESIYGYMIGVIFNDANSSKLVFAPNTAVPSNLVCCHTAVAIVPSKFLRKPSDLSFLQECSS